jgi:apolipoprotein D and lipocalin family protein
MTASVDSRAARLRPHLAMISTMFLPMISAMLAFSLIALLSACSTAPPEGLQAVTPFDVQRYQGTWYEIARLDHSFERNLTDVSASYTVQAEGSMQVMNRGFNTRKNEWKEAVGKALFTGKSDRGSLKVSFFGPFYGGYHVVALDPEYRWSMVVGPDRDYLWILARDKQLDPLLKAQLLRQAQALGLRTEQLIWVTHTR